MFNAWFWCMGDVHSTAGDENGVLYATFPISAVNVFRGVVRQWDAQTGELTYDSFLNAHALGSGRPIINLNPDAPITQDVVVRRFAVDDPSEYVPSSGHSQAPPRLRR